MPVETQPAAQPPELSRRQPSAALLGLDHLLRIRGDQLSFYRDLRERHGDAVRLRLGPYRTWLLFHPDLIEAVLTREWQHFIRFEKLTNVVKQWNGPSLLLAEGREWRERRRKVLPAFQSKRMPVYAAAVVDHAHRLTQRWDGFAVSGGELSIDTDAVMARLTLDIATTTLFGTEPLVNGDDIETAIQVLSDTAFHESTTPFLLPDWQALPSKRRKRWAMDLMDRTVTGLVRRRLDDLAGGGGRDRGDLLSILVEQHDGDAAAIRNDSMSLLIAGHETSGALLSWLFACLGHAPAELRIVQRELDAVLEGRLPTFADLPALGATTGAIEEALRLYPPAYSLFMRQATTDVTIGDVRVSKGDNVLIVPHALHHDARWYEDPEAFRPSRFRQPPTWPQFAYLPFGAGPRVCIGQSFALMEACLAAATILQTWEPAPLATMPTPSAKFSLRPSGGLPMVWRVRP
ncbi:MAG: cytochrome P450 [Hyphomicrobiaceae bacterium]